MSMFIDGYKVKIIYGAVAITALFVAFLLLGIIPLKQNSINSFYTPFQKTQIGITKEDEIGKISKVLDKQNLNNGTVMYSLESVDPIGKDEVYTKDKVVIYEKTSTYTDKEGGLPKISVFLKTYGNPDKQFTGSREYGASIVTYIYASKGLAFVGNPYSDIIYNIQRFSPTSVEDYLNKYGHDIDENFTESEG